MVGDDVLAEEAGDPGGNRRDEHEPRHTLVGRLHAPATDGTDPRSHEPHDVAPEVRNHGDERSEMERDVERLVEAVVLLEVRPVGSPRHENEVPGRRDRKELGEALDDTQDERLSVRQRGRVVPHSEQRQDDGETEGGARDAEDGGAAHGGILRLGSRRADAEEIARKLRQSGERVA